MSINELVETQRKELYADNLDCNTHILSPKEPYRLLVKGYGLCYYGSLLGTHDAMDTWAEHVKVYMILIDGEGQLVHWLVRGELNALAVAKLYHSKTNILTHATYKAALGLDN